MLRGGLTQGGLGLPATLLEMMQVQSVTWIPAAQPGIRLDWGMGEELAHLSVARPTKSGQKERGEMGQLLRPSPI